MFNSSENQNARVQRLLSEVVSHPLIKRGLTGFGHTASVHLRIEESGVINAHATEVSNQCIIILTTAIIQLLSDEELKAVLAHESSHLIYRDYKSKSSIAFIFSLLIAASIFVFAMKYSHLFLSLMPLSITAYYFVHYSFFQIAESRADRLAVKVVGKEVVLSLFSKALYHEVKKDMISSLIDKFSTHPDSHKRIEAIQRL